MPNLLSAILISAAVLPAAPTIVRVADRAGGPRILVDGKAVPPRMFFGYEGPGKIRAETGLVRADLRVHPSGDVPRNGTLHFRFGQSPEMSGSPMSA